MKWYYSLNNEQCGPVTFEELKSLAAQGIVNKNDTLVWQEGSVDWVPALSVPELFTHALSDNPYATPQTALDDPTYGDMITEPEVPDIIHGSQPIDASSCISRAFTLTKRHFTKLFVLGLVFFAIIIAVSFVLEFMDAALGLRDTAINFNGGLFFTLSESSSDNGSLLNNIIAEIVSLFLTMGAISYVFRLVDGKPAELSLLFSQSSKLLKAIVANLIYGFAVSLGLCLLIVPGIYVMTKYGFYKYAIVDRDLGIMESLNYSASITENSKMNLFALGFLLLLLILAGAIAMFVGLIFVIPMVEVSIAVAYRWMQRGSQYALNDKTII